MPCSKHAVAISSNKVMSFRHSRGSDDGYARVSREGIVYHLLQVIYRAMCDVRKNDHIPWTCFLPSLAYDGTTSVG